MLGLKRTALALEPYDPGWCALFAEEQRAIAAALGSNVVGIYHVGSTAIQGALAKPILDIAVAVKDLSAIATGNMERLGYECRGELGIPGRCYLVKRRDGDVSTHHVHCYQEGHPALSSHLLFCRYLNDHPDAVAQYNALKLRLAGEFAQDRVRYTDGKSEFVQRILALAREQYEALALATHCKRS